MIQKIYTVIKRWFVKETDADGLAKGVLLHKSIEEGELLLVESLLDAQADATVRMEDGLTGLMRATFHGHQDIVELLLRRDVGDLQDDGGFGSLSIACMQGYKEIVRVLVAHGSQVGLEGHNGSAALEIALYFDDKEMFELLLQGGASLDIQDKALGQTILIRAVIEGRTDIVKLLLERGARCDLTDNGGESALMWASKKGYDEIVTLLKK